MRQQRSLVTGGAGFIGSHLVDMLLARGGQVRVLDNLSGGVAANLTDAARHPNFDLVVGSVLDARTVDKLVAEADVVFHLAAAVGVRRIVERPLESFLTNLRGTELVLEAVHGHGRRLILASSSEIYGRNPQMPLSEQHDLVIGPPSVTRWSYALSKAADETLVEGYRLARGTRATTARLFNTVGPRQSGEYGMVVPRLVGQALAGQPLTVYGSGQQTRCFCHVADVVEALLRLAASDQTIGETYNVGSTTEISILDLAELIRCELGSTSQIHLTPYQAVWGERFEDVQRRVPDTSRLAAAVGWQPRRDPSQIVADVAAHLRATTGQRVGGRS